jgi:hypothetical protein
MEIDAGDGWLVDGPWECRRRHHVLLTASPKQAFLDLTVSRWLTGGRE